MGVYFFEKSLSFQGPVLCIVFEILKLPQNFSPKLGYINLDNKQKKEKIANFRGNFAKKLLSLEWPKLMRCLPNP